VETREFNNKLFLLTFQIDNLAQMNANDPSLKSFVEVDPTSHFPIQNLPYGVFKSQDKDARVGVAIGEYVLDLKVLHDHKFFKNSSIESENIFDSDNINGLMKKGPSVWKYVRDRISYLLQDKTPDLQNQEKLFDIFLYKIFDIKLLLPIRVSEFTDFYASYYHAFNVGSLVRGPENALMPNWKHLPVGYHGRSSSIVVSGTNIRRPWGQTKGPDDEVPKFGPSQRLDFELEMGTVVGVGNKMGAPVKIADADNHLFGMLLVNDWSARDIQFWEYQPLGPFLGKNFATSVAPWVVTLDALAPFKVEAMEQDVGVLPYLKEQERTIYDINLEVHIKNSEMEKSDRLTQSNFKYLYWTISQQLAHHTSPNPIL